MTSPKQVLSLIFGVAAIAILIAAAGCASTHKGKEKESPPPEALTQLQENVKKAQDAVAKNPGDAECQYHLGNALFDMQRYKDARAAYETSLKISAKNAATWCNLGLCLRRMGLNDEAISAYREALSLDPKDSTTRFNLVAIFETEGNFEGASRELQLLAEQQPNDLQVAAHLGNALFRSGKFQEAATAFEKVLRLDPGCAGHYYNLGLCFFYQQNWDATLATWLTALAHDAKDPQTNKGLAVVYWKRGDYKQAWDAVVRCQALGVALDPDFIGDLQKDSGQKGP